MADQEHLSQDADLLLGKVATEYFERLSRGESPQIEEYVERYPQIGDVIRHALPALQVVNESIFGEGHAKSNAVPKTTQESAEKRLGDFRLRREIGRGGMGIVYEAEQISMGGRLVALKVLPFATMVDDKQLQRFRNEVRAAASLDHPHIVSVYSIGEERGVHFYAMQLIRGQSLASVIYELRQLHQQAPLAGQSLSQIASRAEAEESKGSSNPTLDHRKPSLLTEVTSGTTQKSKIADQPKQPITQPAAETVRDPQAALDTVVSGTSHRGAEYHRSVAELAIQAARALQHAHERGVIHRDIKPANLIIDAHADLFITDFGLAHMEENVGLTMTGDLIGTLRYMSPEQAMSNRVAIDHRTDIYSLGITFYELLTTQYAHDGSDRARLLRQIAFQELKPLRKVDRTVPRDLETIIHKAAAKDPEERYSSANDMANDLQAFLDHKAIRAQPPSLADRARKFVFRNQTAALATGVALLLGIIGLAVSNALVWHAKQEAELSRLQAETNASLATVQRDIADARKYCAEQVFQIALYGIGLKSNEVFGSSIESTISETANQMVAKEYQLELQTLNRFPHESSDSFALAVNHTAYAAWLAENGFRDEAEQQLLHAISAIDTLTLAAHTGWADNVKWLHVDLNRAVSSLVKSRNDIPSPRHARVLGMAFGPDGLLYVAGRNTNSIMLFDPSTGCFLDHIVSIPFPHGLAFGPSGELFVSSDYGDAVYLVTRDTESYKSRCVATVDKPVGLALGPDGDIFVASYDSDCILRLDGITGAFIEVFVQPNSGGLQSPTGLTFGPDGCLYVAAQTENCVFRFDGMTGKYLDRFADGNVEWPVYLAFGPDSNLYVCGRESDAISLYHGRTGNAMRRIYHPDLYFVEGLAFEDDGTLYANNSATNAILRIDSVSGEVLEKLSDADCQ